MPAFDSTTNFNATWSNSFATIVLAPGNAVGAGFARASGKHYFELRVDTNPTLGNLYLGILWRGGASQLTWLLGGDSAGNWLVSNASGDLTSRMPTVGSLTWSAGDVFGVAVNYSGDGVGGLSSITFSDGAGVGYAVIETSRNGVFTGNRAVFTATGALMGARPLVAQATGTTLSAVVSLRVDTISYSYLPAGYSQWGASGGVTGGAPTVVDWGWLTAGGAPGSTLLSVTNSNHLLTVATGVTLSSSTVQMGWRSQKLPMTSQKTSFEIYSPYSTSFATEFRRFHIVRDTAGGATEWYSFSTTRTDVWSVAGIWAASPSVVQPGGTAAALQFALQNTGNLAPNKAKGIQVFYDVTRGMNLFGELTNGGVASISFFDVDVSAQSITITSSQTVFVAMTVETIGDFAAANQQDVWLNPGSVRGFDWPMFPGWRSVDNSRVVYGGCSWGATNHVTVQNEIRALLTTAGAGNGYGVRASVGHTTGKRYWELRYYTPWPSIFVGVARTTTASALVIGTVIADGIYLQQETFTNKQNVVYGVTTSASTTISFDFNGLAERFCCAVDFDVGRIWFGYGNASERVWQTGDPSAGTGGVTFTAGSLLYPAFAQETPNSFLGYAAFESAACRFAPPTGFSEWNTNYTPPASTTVTITPSFTGTASASGTIAGGSGGGVRWPFGVRP